MVWAEVVDTSPIAKANSRSNTNAGLLGHSNLKCDIWTSQIRRVDNICQPPTIVRPVPDEETARDNAGDNDSTVSKTITANAWTLTARRFYSL
jgi:hypothetical protein